MSDFAGLFRDFWHLPEGFTVRHILYVPYLGLKSEYQNDWKKANEREEKAKLAFEKIIGPLSEFGTGTKSSEMIIRCYESYEDYLFHKADPDYRSIVSPNIFLEVSGSVFDNGKIYLNPEKVKSLRRHPERDVIYTHVTDDQDLIRFFHINDVDFGKCKRLRKKGRTYGFYVIPEKYYQVLDHV